MRSTVTTTAIVSLPQDEQKIIIDKITSAPMNDKVKLLDQILKDGYSNPQHFSSLLRTGEFVNAVNQHNTKIPDQCTFNKQQDVVDDSNEGVATIETIDGSDANYTQ